METGTPRGLRAALQPEALRAALRPERPVFRNPWDSEVDILWAYLVVSVLDLLLLFAGGEFTGAVFGFDTHWSLGVFMAAALVGAAGFITIVGRERTSLSADLVAIAAWLVLGMLVAPILGLALPTGAALACYGVMLVMILAVVRGIGVWETAFIRSLSWPLTWSALALLFAFTAHDMVFYR